MKPRAPRIKVPAEAVRTPEQILAGLYLSHDGKYVWLPCSNCGGTGNYPSSMTPPGKCRFYCWADTSRRDPVAEAMGAQPPAKSPEDPTFGKRPILAEKYVKKQQAADRRDYRAPFLAQRAQEQRAARIREAMDSRIETLAQAFALDPANLPRVEYREGWRSSEDVALIAGRPVSKWTNTAVSLIEQWAEKGELTEKQWELAARLPTIEAEEAARREQREAQRAASQHIGQPGERLDVAVTVENVKEFENTASQWGRVRTRVMMRDQAGNVLVWWTGYVEPAELKPGARLTIRATVKRHTEWKGEKQTELLRVTVQSQEALL